jgi:hypothetical protein
MLVEEKILKRTIIEETIFTMVERGLIKEARTYLLENEEHLDEGALLDLFKRVLPRSTELGGEGYVDRLLKKIDQEDQKEVDELDKAVATKLDDEITQDIGDDNKFEPNKVKAAVEAWFKQRRQDAPGERLESEEDIERAVMAVIDNLKNAEVEQIANTGGEEDAQDTGGEEDAQDTGGEELEAETPAKTALDLKGIFTDPTQRNFLLRGLIRFLSINQVERSLQTLKPAAEKEAIESLLTQILEMNPETFEKLQNEMRIDYFWDLVGDGDIRDKMSTKGGARSVPARTKRFKRKLGREGGASRYTGQSSNLTEHLENMIILSLIKECINKKNKNIL